MPEVEALHWMDGVAYPSREILIVQALPTAISSLAQDKFLDILVAEFILSTKIPDDILNSDVAIMIRV